jgi:quinol monooxygenase YgiN
MAIVIAGFLKVPEDKLDYLLQAGRELVLASRAEPGCKAYVWSSVPAEPGIIQVHEHWQDEASLAAHFAGPAYLGTLKLLAEIREIEADFNKFRVDAIEAIFDDEGNPRADFFTT